MDERRYGSTVRSPGDLHPLGLQADDIRAISSSLSTSPGKR
jgi:hypothetical protein